MIELSIEHQPDRYLRSPRLVAQPDGTAILYVIAWQGATERVHSYRIEPSGQISGPSAGRERSAIPGLTRGDTVQETTDIREDLEETRDGHTLWVQHRGGIASVRLERPNKHPLVVYRARGTAMAPSLALAADGGVWIAFHTDVREDTGRADVAKWIALRYVDPAGKIWQPAALMPERDRMGIEQSFEFPAMATGADGALRLFGRGSHAFFRQDFTHAGAGERRLMKQWIFRSMF